MLSKEEIAALVVYLRTIPAWVSEEAGQSADAIDQLQRENAELREVLEVYAFPMPETADGGKQARDLLAKWNQP